MERTAEKRLTKLSEKSYNQQIGCLTSNRTLHKPDEFIGISQLDACDAMLDLLISYLAQASAKQQARPARERQDQA